MQVAFFLCNITRDNAYNVRLAEIMVRSARKVMPEIRIVQMSDMEAPRIDGTDAVQRLKRNEPLMPYRLKHHAALNGDDVLFVDTDIMFRESLVPVFEESFDVMLTERRNEIILDSVSLENVTEAMPFNTGVMGSKTPGFWRDCYEECVKLPKRDQDWFGDQLAVVTVAKSGKYNILELPCSEYNFTPLTKQDSLENRKVIHFKGDRKKWMLFDSFSIIGGVEIPKFPTFAAVKDDARGQNMAIALTQGFPMLDQVPFHDGEITIACYGPSLEDTWKNLKQPIMTVSGAHDFLVSKGIIPRYHCDSDPREYKAEWVKNPQSGCTYIMGSCQHPKTWEYLKGMDVRLWHVYNGPETIRWLRKNRPDKDCVYWQNTPHVAICGGSTIGLRAMEIAGFLGYKKVIIHGMDSSVRENKTHAAHHNGAEQKSLIVRVGERQFRTTPQLIEAAREAMNVIKRYAQMGVIYTVCGDGMLQHMLRSAIIDKNLDTKVIDGIESCSVEESCAVR